MTDTKPSDVEGLIEVTQADRDMVAWLNDEAGFTSEAERTRNGEHDNRRRVQAFARHRLAAEASAATTLAAQQARVEALERALKRIAEGDEPRPVATSWFPDGRASKHDKCAHDVWMYEACGNCISDFAAAALKEPTP